MQKLLAIAGLTWKAAFRFRLFPFLLGLLLVVVVGLPLVIRDDGTARGLMQILLTYTLGSIATLLGLATLWTACGTLARDVEECQVQMVAVKPVARWQIWLGKWLGLVTLNAALLAVAGGVLFALVHWRAEKLPAAQKEILNRELLIGRASFTPEKPDLEKLVEQELEARLARAEPLDAAQTAKLRAAIREQMTALAQIIAPMQGRRWMIDLGRTKDSLRGRPMQLRVKFLSSDPAAAPLGRRHKMFWQIGVPGTAQLQRGEGALPPEEVHEFPLAPDLFDENGALNIECHNREEQTAMLVPLDGGVEVLYRESGFGLNFARGLAVIWLWLALLAALGLAAASFLSFPVAAFLAMSALAVFLSGGMLAGALESTATGAVDEHGRALKVSLVERAARPLIKSLFAVASLAESASPVEALSTGRSITWAALGMSFVQILVILGGALAAVGMVTFTRRELATAQGTH